MSFADGTRKRTLSNFLSLSVLQLGNYVLPMITLPIISRIIGPENYGAINYAFAFVGYFIMFINAGFDLYGTRLIVSYNGDQEKISQLFSKITFAKTYSLLIATVAFSIAVVAIPQVREYWLVHVFTYLMCVGWVLNPSWFYNGMQDAKRYAMFSFVSKVLFSVAVVLMVREKGDYLYHPLITSVAHILVSYISFRWAIKKFNVRLVWVKFKDVIQTLKENSNLSLTWWITNQSSSSGIIIAGFLISAAALGNYSAALRMVMIVLSVVSMPLNTVLFPVIGKSFSSGKSEGLEQVNRIFPYLFILAGAMCLGTWLVAEPLMLLFFGDQFADSIPLLKIMSLVLLFSTINGAFGQQVMLNLKKDKAYTRFILGGFLLNIMLLVLLIPVYGAMGAAIAWPASELVVFCCYLVYFRRQNLRVFQYEYYRPNFIVSNAAKLLSIRKKAL